MASQLESHHSKVSLVSYFVFFFSLISSCSSSISLSLLFYEEPPPAPPPAAKAAGLLTTKITESPRKNILLTYRSLLTAVFRCDVLRDFDDPPLEYSVHISLTSSSSL